MVASEICGSTTQRSPASAGEPATTSAATAAPAAARRSVSVVAVVAVVVVTPRSPHLVQHDVDAGARSERLERLQYGLLRRHPCAHDEQNLAHEAGHHLRFGRRE